MSKTEKGIFGIVSFEEGFSVKEEEFQEYLGSRILNSYLAQSMDGKSNYIIRHLIKAFLSNPQQLPDATIVTLYKNFLKKEEWDKVSQKPFPELVGHLRNLLKNDHFQKNKEEYRNVLLRVVCDYIAGMTDKYALDQYELLYGYKQPGKW